jgi:DNA polymerase III delta prime subunit
VTVSGAPEDLSQSGGTRAERVAAARTAWTRHLVDLGGRNTLLWYRDLAVGTLDLTTAHPSGVAALMGGRPTRLSDLVREPGALDEARRRVRAIAAKARELHEERGVLTCFVAMGMATWSVPTPPGLAPRVPAAPVLLRACTLRPTTPAQQDYVLDLDDEVELNPVLVHYLSSEQRISLDVEHLEELARGGTGIDPYPVYAALRQACAAVPDFAVAPRLLVGTFSYTKLPMVADLEASAGVLESHDVIAALAGDPDALRAVRTSGNADALEPGADVVPDPAAGFLVLDADSSQQAAIEAARSGSHLVIHGPPGTGKSQTIANLIAALAAEGKSVLFVAEKRAAIDAVVGRLDRVGLADLVLDLHDGSRSRRRVARDLTAALDAAQRQVKEPDSRSVDVLRESAGILREHRAALHEVRAPWGVSVYDNAEAITRLGHLPRPPRSRVRIHGADLRALTPERRASLGAALNGAAALGAWSTTPGVDPWFGARILSGEEASEARDRLSAIGEDGIERLGRTVTEVFARIRIPATRSVREWGDLIAMTESVRRTLDVIRPEVFDTPLDDLVAATGSRAFRAEHGSQLGFWERLRLKRQARSLLRPGAPPPDLHAALRTAHEQRAGWRALAGGGGRPEMPADLDQARAAYDSIAGHLIWLDERLASTAAAGATWTSLLDLDRNALAATLRRLADSPDRLAVVPTVVTALDELAAAGFGPFVDDLAKRKVRPEDVGAEFDFVWRSSIGEEVGVADARIGAHDGDQLRRTVAAFAAADEEVLRHNATRVRAAVSQRIRSVAGAHPELETLVRAEGAKSRRHRAIRDLLPQAAPLLTALQPCWVMSPLVVASALPPGVWFDTVIFDEASQIPPAEAVSALSRARQVVLAGDAEQLPPTTFFASVSEAADEGSPALTTGMESILDVLAAALPARQLTWHYRSLDERLIAFANEHVYGGTLRTFPGVGGDPVVTHELVDGLGMPDPGSAVVESTSNEVDRVVELVLEHARSRPRESLGVIALGITHANRLEDAIRRAVARADEETAAFFTEDVFERFFVKNLERVQGDERDAIILSIGYGRTAPGRILHRFGPLNNEGGHRRLNVAITRARRRMTVVSSFAAEDLDPSRLKAAGAVMLRDYLAYAAQGGPARPSGSGGSGGDGSALMADFAARLRRQGLTVHENLGSSADPVDLAIEDPARPGELVLAVESDGPTYAAMGSARDRDRLRAEQLERIGWRHLRVWTTDIFRDPARELARVRQAAQPAGGVSGQGATASTSYRGGDEPPSGGEAVGGAETLAGGQSGE